MATESEFVQLAGMALALEMMRRAYEALALLYELRHPGEYSQQSRDLKDYVAGNFRHVEQDLKGGETRD
ncbi:hypothetical protein ACRAWG_06205 [Methylobacterium sp. P31]